MVNNHSQHIIVASLLKQNTTLQQELQDRYVKNFMENNSSLSFFCLTSQCLGEFGWVGGGGGGGGS